MGWFNHLKSQGNILWTTAILALSGSVDTALDTNERTLSKELKILRTWGKKIKQICF